MADLTLRLVKGSPLTNAEVDANFSNLNEAITAGGEPMGHADRAQSTLSFDAGTRTVSIAPVSGSFTVWVKGNKFDFTTAQTVVIPDTTGLHYVFFDASGVLSTRMAYFDWPNEAPTAYVAWNSDTGAAPFFADERHGVTLDWQTHEYLHRTRGAALANGFSLSNYSVVGDGSSDAHAQLDLSGGTFFDEDLQVDITPSNTPTANTWEQDLTGPAQIPVMYRSGTGWVRDTVTNFVLKAGTATPRYNTQSGGVWGLTDVPNNSYSSVCILATNNLTYPVVAIMGQHADSNISDIEDIDWADLNLDGFPAVEFRPLYKIVFQCSTSYSNTIKARFVKVFDKRNIVASSPAATIGSSHGGLSGLGADDHLQYLHITEVRSPSQAVKNSFLPAQTGNNGKFLTTDGLNPSWATMTAPNNGTLTLAVSGTGLSGSASFTADQAGNSTFVVTSNATSANTAGAIVARDGSGNFSANVITATSFSGSASGLTGLKTVNGNSILGSGNIQIDGGVTSFNARTGAITLSSADVTGALGFTPYNSTNPNGYTTNLGTVVGVTAGTGLTGGTITSSGTISLATSGVAAGTYTKVTVDVYGRATTGTSLSSSDVTTALGYTPPQPTGTGASGTWGISVSGNAATATTLQTARLINGVSFNGSADITVADSTKLPLAGGSLTGVLSSNKPINLANATHGTQAVLVGNWSGTGWWGLGSESGHIIKLDQVAYADTAAPTWVGATDVTLKLGTKTVLDSGNYTSYAAPATHYHDRIYNGASGSSNYLLLSSGNELEFFNSAGAIQTLYLQYSGDASSLRGPGGNVILHAGNYSSYALPLSGGTVTGFVNISTGTSQPLRLTTSSGGPWALELYRSDTATSTKVYNDGARWYFEHRPSFAGATPLDSSNYSSYALPLSGGTLTGRTVVNINGRTTGYTGSNLEVYTGDNTPPGISFHRGGYSATLLYEIDGELYINAWTTRAQSGKLLSSGNYTSYAAASAAGGCVVENGQTISANYTMTSGKNGMSAGPITISSGITVTIPSGSSWSIV